MRSTLLTTLFLFLFATVSLAQNTHTINGSVIDTTTSAKLLNTAVSVLRAKDSTLVKFTRVNENGTFSLENLPKGNFFLFVTYPGYADYVEHFILDSTKTAVNFGKIKLFTKERLLEDVIIRGKAAAIKIKGDTTEFNASSYVIQANSKVEDLLKQLPGIQVDKDGKITAQGQTVNKVLLDGEEFFGDDPTLVTKNIRGDMVDKVQLYDKKSDQATFTGVDDGKKEKTINIKLKEDKKNGYFGKLTGAVGNKDFYETQGMFNAFKAKQKLSVFGTLANTGKTGLGWQESRQYGSSGTMEYSQDEGFMSFNSGGDEIEAYDGSYNGEGIPVARTGGAHYDSKWNKDKSFINANYKIGSMNVEGAKNIITQNNLPTGIIESTNNQNFDKFIFRQKADVTYLIKPDSTSSIKFFVDGTAKHSKNNTSFGGRSLLNGNLLNESERDVINDVNDKWATARIFWSKKLKKKGRTVSIGLSQYAMQSESDGFLKSTNDFYNISGGLDSTQIVDQEKTSLVKSSVFNSNIAYTEPISKTLTLVVNYGFSVNNSSANRKSFNQSSPGNYNLLDTLYSNNYKLDQISNQGGAIFNYKKDKTVINFGTKLANVSFDQKDLYRNVSFKRNFLNWNPEATYRYNFTQQRSIYVNYRGNTSQPSIDQIQPVRINTDPLNITSGNPDLKPSFASRISVNYNSYKVLTSQNIYAGINYSFINNQIVNNTVTDSAGKSTYKAVNLTGKTPYNFNFYGQFSQKIPAIDLSAGLYANVSGGNNYSFINNALNENKSRSISTSLYLSKYAEKKYDAYLSFGPTYSTTESSLQKQTNDNGWGLNGSGSFRIFLPAKFELNSEGTYEYRTKTKSFDQSFSRVIVNANIAKKFLKAESLKLSLGVNDLFNQNRGFNRSNYGNMISQTNFTTIQRYFMASISWDFNKMGGASTK